MNTEQKIEFHKIKEQWMDLAVTQAAKDRIRKTTFFLSESDLRRQLRDTADSRSLIERLGAPPLQNLEEIKEIMAAAGKGDCLTPYQLERVEKVLVAVKRFRDYLLRGKPYDNPLAYYGDNFHTLEELREEIGRQIRNGAVDDYASKTLRQIREQMAVCEEQMKQKAEQVMRSNKSCMADSYCTFRNGRICVPVKKEYKLKIPGSVIGKSSTGSTLFMEPSGAAKFYEELQMLKIGEENEIYRILYTLTAMTADAADAMAENISLMEKLDFILSKGKLSMDMKAVEPSINTDRRIVLKDARHPLMDPSVNIPLQFELGTTAEGGKTRGIVITGPNTGGKTVAIKTVMLNCMMAQCGLHVPCKEADICMNGSYLCDIGDGQDITENLSTFSAHIKNVLEVLNNINRESFVIMDELGSGTDPVEGMGIAIAILEELRKSGANFLVTTHYPEVKEYARKTPDIVNAKMTFNQETLLPTYQMVIGEAGESCAFHIADRLGMPEEMLKTAVRAAYGEEAAAEYPFRGQKKTGSAQTKQREPDDASRYLSAENTAKKAPAPKISTLKKQPKRTFLTEKYKLGDSVMVYPDKKIGIVCKPVNEKGILRVQLPDKKIWINHKRVKLHVAAEELYPENYDFSVLFETVADRKIRHDMERKYTEEIICRKED